jgi:hypothetical protein
MAKSRAKKKVNLNRKGTSQGDVIRQINGLWRATRTADNQRREMSNTLMRVDLLQDVILKQLLSNVFRRIIMWVFGISKKKLLEAFEKEQKKLLDGIEEENKRKAEAEESSEDGEENAPELGDGRGQVDKGEAEGG